MVAIAGVAVAQAGRADPSCGVRNENFIGYSGSWNSSRGVGFNSAVHAETSGGNRYLILCLGSQQDELFWDWYGEFGATDGRKLLCEVGINTNQTPNGFGTSVQSGAPGSGNSCNGATEFSGGVSTCACRWLVKECLLPTLQRLARALTTSGTLGPLAACQSLVPLGKR